MADKLEIETVRLEAAKAICLMRLADEDLRAFKRIVRTEAVYIVAEAATVREQQREQRKESAA